MSRLDANFATTVLPLHLHHTGTVVSYEHPDAEPVALTAVVGPIRHVLQEDEGGGGVNRTLERVVTISRDPDGTYGGVADPGVPGVFVIDGVDWAVSDEAGLGEFAPELTDAYARLRVVRVEPVQRSRPGWRR